MAPARSIQLCIGRKPMKYQIKSVPGRGLTSGFVARKTPQSHLPVLVSDEGPSVFFIPARKLQLYQKYIIRGAMVVRLQWVNKKLSPVDFFRGSAGFFQKNDADSFQKVRERALPFGLFPRLQWKVIRFRDSDGNPITLRIPLYLRNETSANCRAEPGKLRNIPR